MTPAPTEAARTDELDGTSFVADDLSVDGHTRPSSGGTTITITFDGGRLWVKTACNGASGVYRLEGDKLVTGALASTRKGCSPELEEQDRLLIELLSGSPSVTNGGDAL